MRRIHSQTVWPETVWLVVVCALDTAYTLVAVKLGFARETNPWLAVILERSEQLFVLVKMLTLLMPVIGLELLRPRYPDLARRGMRLALAGYITIYVLGSLVLLSNVWHPFAH